MVTRRVINAIVFNTNGSNYSKGFYKFFPLLLRKRVNKKSSRISQRFAKKSFAEVREKEGI